MAPAIEINDYRASIILSQSLKSNYRLAVKYHMYETNRCWRASIARGRHYARVASSKASAASPGVRHSRQRHQPTASAPASAPPCRNKSRSRYYFLVADIMVVLPRRRGQRHRIGLAPCMVLKVLRILSKSSLMPQNIAFIACRPSKCLD